MKEKATAFMGKPSHQTCIGESGNAPTQDAIDSSRLKAEAASFQDFLLKFEKLWKNTLEEHLANRGST